MDTKNNNCVLKGLGNATFSRIFCVLIYFWMLQWVVSMPLFFPRVPILYVPYMFSNKNHIMPACSTQEMLQAEGFYWMFTYCVKNSAGYFCLRKGVWDVWMKWSQHALPLSRGGHASALHETLLSRLAYFSNTVVHSRLLNLSTASATHSLCTVYGHLFPVAIITRPSFARSGACWLAREEKNSSISLEEVKE